MKLDRNFLILLDALGQRYGRLPSELVELSPKEWSICMNAMTVGVQEQKRQIERARRRIKRK